MSGACYPDLGKARELAYPDQETPQVTAEAAILIDGITGQVLYDKNADQVRPPASTTKMITAIIALEACADLGEAVSIGAKPTKATGSTVGLKSGQVYALEALLEGALIPSGNDACVAISEHIAGSEILFAHWMNKKAWSLGARNTIFQNSNGLPNLNHVSTAGDLALIARFAMQNAEFSRIVNTKNAAITPIEGNTAQDDSAKPKTLNLKNTNALLWDYPGANGVKTGTTSAAGACLVASAIQEDRWLIAVVLKSRNRFQDATKLLNYGFQELKPVGVLIQGEVLTLNSLVTAKKEPIEVVVEDRMGMVVPNWQIGQVQQNIQWNASKGRLPKSGTPVGEVSLSYQGNVLQRSRLLMK